MKEMRNGGPGKNMRSASVRWVHLVRLVCLQTDNFHLFLRQQIDKWKTSIYMMSKW
jgi:hypothetical protein